MKGCKELIAYFAQVFGAGALAAGCLLLIGQLSHNVGNKEKIEKQKCIEVSPESAGGYEWCLKDPAKFYCEKKYLLDTEKYVKCKDNFYNTRER